MFTCASRPRVLQQQQDSLAGENRRLQQERDDAASKLAVLQGETGRLHNDTSALLKLRAEVAKLRAESRELAQMKAAAAASSDQDPAETVMKSWLDRARKLKDRLAQTPDQSIPEFKFLTDQDWFDAVRKTRQLETDSDFSQAFTALRSAAKSEFASTVQDALSSYSQANNGQLPTDFSQLKPYFAPSVDDSVLQNYSITQPGTVTEKTGSLIDPDGNYHSSRMEISPGSVSRLNHDRGCLTSGHPIVPGGEQRTDPHRSHSIAALRPDSGRTSRSSENHPTKQAGEIDSDQQQERASTWIEQAGIEEEAGFPRVSGATNSRMPGLLDTFDEPAIGNPDSLVLRHFSVTGGIHGKFQDQLAAFGVHRLDQNGRPQTAHRPRSISAGGGCSNGMEHHQPEQSHAS